MTMEVVITSMTYHQWVTVTPRTAHGRGHWNIHDYGGRDYFDDLSPNALSVEL